jgi:hypothetical protein
MTDAYPMSDLHVPPRRTVGVVATGRR